jgi:hypothetical protein
MALLASDANNPEFTGAYNPDSRLAVQFYTRPVQNEFQSNLQGRPIFDDVDFVKIFIPGDSTTTIDTAVHESHKKRFPQQWAYYQNNKNSDQIHGTAISAWPLLTPGQVEQLKAMKFYTVESVASSSDAQIGNIGMIGGMQPHTFRERAQLFLKVANDESIAAKQAAEISKMKAEQEERDRKHAEEMAELRALIVAQNAQPEERKRPGPKPRQQEAA